MNERIESLIDQMNKTGFPYQAGDHEMTVTGRDLEYFAELIVQECTAVLFDESERLSELSLNEVNWNYALEYEVCSNQCINDIALIEKHFGVE